MSYSLSVSISLGQAYAGRTLAAQLFDTAGVAVGDEITTGFVEYGTQGEYALTAAIPDNHRGAMVVYESGNSGVCWACAVNPEEADAGAIAAGLLDLTDGVETGVTLRQAVRRMAAVLAGKVNGAGSGTETFTGLDGATPRVEVATDQAGNRLSVTYDPS